MQMMDASQQMHRSTSDKRIEWQETLEYNGRPQIEKLQMIHYIAGTQLETQHNFC
jgi:hypothetical protein